MSLRRLLAVAACALAVPAASADALRLPAAPRCPVFPATNAWNQRIDRLPVASSSAAIIGSIGADRTLHPDFGSGLWEGGPIGIPITVATKRTPRCRVEFQYAGESDRGPYPIPRGVKIEGGPRSNGDRHALIVDRDRCRVYELFALYPKPGAAGGPARVRSGTCARTACGPPGGRRRTRPGCRSCRDSHATTRSPAAASTTRFVSPSAGRGAPTSGPPGTSPATSRTRACRPWACACG